MSRKFFEQSGRDVAGRLNRFLRIGVLSRLLFIPGQLRNRCENDERHNGANQCSELFANSHCHSDGGGKPDACGCGEPFDLFFRISRRFQNGRCAQKPHRRAHALNDATCLARVDSDEHVGARTGGFSAGLALEAQHAPHQRRQHWTSDDARDLREIYEVGKLLGDGFRDGVKG